MASYSPDISIRVAVIEENAVEREYLLALVSRAPGVKVLAAYGSLTGTVAELEQEPPDLVIADLRVLDDFTVNWLRNFRTVLPHTAMLVLSDEKEREPVFQALEAGVSGWLQKPCTGDQIVRAILVLHDGGAVLSSPVARQILKYFHARGTSVDCLSHREREVLNLLGRGLQAMDIAARLGLTPSTVRTHVRNLLQKLKVTSRTEAVAKYLNPVS